VKEKRKTTSTCGKKKRKGRGASDRGKPACQFTGVYILSAEGKGVNEKKNGD